MKNAAVGLRVHSGWTALVVVCVENAGPVVLLRERPELVKTFSYKFRQPYHTAEKLPFARGREFISSVNTEARQLSYRALRAAQAESAKRGYHLTACGLLLASGRPLPALQNILASHALIHTADGQLFRNALTHASARCALPVFSLRESELLKEAAQTLGQQETSLLKRVTELGKSVGSPWTQDEKYAALVAWLALLQPKAPADTRTLRAAEIPGQAI